MLELNRRLRSSTAESGDHGFNGSSLTETLTSIGGIFRRQLPLVVLIVLCTVGAGLFYLMTSPSLYTATASMVIDTRKVQLFQQQAIMGEAPIDAGTVQTEVEILKSRNVSAAVVKDLHLADDPEFTDPSSGVVGFALGGLARLIAGREQASEEQKQEKALNALRERMSVSRVGLTYVMSIAFTSRDPGKSATVANAIGDAYITDQLEAKYQATKRASLWLQDRIRELRVQASAADRAVVDFKQKNNITTVDSNGRLMNEQQLSEVNSQRILAQAATAEAKAKLDRINDIMKDAIPDASVADALQSQVIIALRAKYLDLSGREALFSSQYGANHMATVGLRNQMMEIRRNISDEMQKIAQSYKSNYEIAKAREESIDQSLSESVSNSNVTSQAQIQLRELESTAQSYKSMYDNFLQRYMESVQQQSFPITEARLISPASTPSSRSSPKTSIALAVTTLGSLLISLGIAALRESVDQVFRTSRQVEDRLRVPCLAMVPVIKERLAGTELTIGDDSKRLIAAHADLSRYVIQNPFSQFTEALRSAKVAADLVNTKRESRILGITSTLPNEGKSTISSNFSQLIAHAGGRVLLVDCDLRNPSLSRMMTDGAKLGFVDVIAGRASLEDVLWLDESSNLNVLPVGGGEARLTHTSEILGSHAVRSLFDRLSSSYDYIIVDLSPLAPVVDARTTSSFIDSYIYVVEWGRTKIDIVEHNLHAAPEISDRVLGILMNKADMKILGRYEDYSKRSYYRNYSKYVYNS